MQARQLANLQRRFTRLGIQANKTTAEMNALKNEIYDTARAPDIRVDPSQITSAIEEIVEKTGNLDFARANIRNIALALQATGAEGTAIGGIMAELEKMDIKDPRKVLEAIDTLNVQGKEGAFTLQNLAALGPRVITAYASAVKGGRDGADTLKEMGAALQVIRMGTGSSEQAATAFERLLAELQNVEKLKKLEAEGIQVFDPKQPGAEIMRPINEILLEILEKTKGRRTLLGQIFGDESIRSFNALSIERIQKFMKAHGSGATTMRDSARAANDAAGALQNLYTSWQKFADTTLTDPINDLADTLNYLGEGGLGKDAYELVHNTDATTLAKKIGGLLAYTSRAINPGAALGSSIGQQVGGEVKISVSDDRVRVKQVRQTGNVPIEANTGPMLVGG